jgi:hypothetical protein
MVLFTLCLAGSGLLALRARSVRADEDDEVNCNLTVPANPLSAAGLATPYRLAGPCHQTNPEQSAFVEATVFDPATSQLSVYSPLVVDAGTEPAAAPVAPQVPAGAVVGIWFGFNGDNLTLVDQGGSLGAGMCVNGLGRSRFGQFAHCNAPAFFQAVNPAIAAGAVTVPPLGTGRDGLPCPSTRDWGVVDQDQSDNLTGSFLALGNGRTAQNTAANRAALGAGTGAAGVKAGAAYAGGLRAAVAADPTTTAAPSGGGARTTTAPATTATTAAPGGATTTRATRATTTTTAAAGGGAAPTSTTTAGARSTTTGAATRPTTTTTAGNGDVGGEGKNAGAGKPRTGTQMAGFQIRFNPSDEGLVANILDPLLGCTPWTAPNLADGGTPASSLALNELQAAAHAAAPVALIPTNNPMTEVNGRASAEKTNLYRAGVDMAPVGEGETPAAYCRNLATLAPQRLQTDKALLQGQPSPDPEVARDLFGFLGQRLSASFTELDCDDFGVRNPVRLRQQGEVTVEVTFADAAAAGGARAGVSAAGGDVNVLPRGAAPAPTTAAARGAAPAPTTAAARGAAPAPTTAAPRTTGTRGTTTRGTVARTEPVVAAAAGPDADDIGTAKPPVPAPMAVVATPRFTG